jgi:flagellar operon protein
MTPPVGGVGGVRPPYEPGGSTPARRGVPAGGRSFGDELQRQTGATPAAGGVQFSKHALDRVQRRGIADDPASVHRLEKGVEAAARKGAKSAVVMVDDTAYVVAVPNRTVVTAVDAAHMRDHVFTNIDSAVIA